MEAINEGFDSLDQLFELQPPKPQLTGRVKRETKVDHAWLEGPEPVETWSLDDFSDLLGNPH